MPRHTPRQERILTLARELFAEQQPLLLDTVDGEFYWRICQETIAHEIQAIQVPPTPHLAPYLDKSDNSPQASEARGELFSLVVQAWDALERLRIEAQVPKPVADSLRAGTRVPMRPPIFRQERDHPLIPNTEVLVLYVVSGEWTGRHVAEAIQQELVTNPHLDAAQHFHAQKSVWYRGQDSHDFHLLTSLIRDRTSWNAAGRETLVVVPLPVIEVVIPLPLPEPSAIGEHYDLSVRSRGWHEVLLGGIPTEQTPAVAIRTWSVGLLVATGMRFYDAMWEVSDIGNFEPPSQPRFGADRLLLLKRVPEAKPFVYAGR